MSRWIDAEWLKQNFNTVFWSQIAKTIDSAPSIDIVRCRECKWYDGKGHCKLRYGSLGVFEDVRTDDFCSYGERSSE